MSYRAIACWKKALQCECAAKVATDADARRVYLDVARQWRDRAEHTEKLERHTSASRTGSNAGEQSIGISNRAEACRRSNAERAAKQATDPEASRVCLDVANQ